MDPQFLPSSVRRRSDRVSIVFPVEVAGIDVGGKRFSERARTTTVSRYGCCLSLQTRMQADQKLHLRRIGTNEMTTGRIVATMGMDAAGRLYGVGTSESCEDLWGIRFSSNFYEKVLDHMHDGVYFVNREREITYWNHGAEGLTGYSGGEVVGKRCNAGLLGHIDENGTPLCKNGCPLHGVMLDGQPRQMEVYLQHKEGYRVPVTVRAFPMRNGLGTIVGAVEVFQDASHHRRVEKRVNELERLAFSDTLTGLPNRRYLEMKVDQALQEHRSLDRAYGLLMFDLDRFKTVNDSYGHGAGDALLKVAAESLTRGLRPGDLVGRWGGEEFVALLPDLNAVGLGDLAERCRLLISRSSVATGSSQVSITASIGATVLDHSDSMESAIRRADALMYESKHSGGDRATAG